MPAGQAHTTWFPELKHILKNHWNFGSDIQDHFQLMDTLNRELSNVRLELNVKPSTFFCRKCNERHESKLQMVTLTAMYFALERFEIIDHKEHLKLLRNWRKYSKQNAINIHGEQIKTDGKTKSLKHFKN